VSNWRERDPESFPSPAGGDTANPLFASADVLGWLRGRGIEPNIDAVTVVWSVVNGLRGNRGVDQLELLTLLVACDKPHGEIRQRFVDLNDLEFQELVRAIEAVPRAELPGIVDQVLERLSRWSGRGGSEYGTVHSRVSQLFTNVVIARNPKSIYDPAVGIGSALLQIASDIPGLEQVRGQDVNETAIEIAGLRAQLRGLDVQLDPATDVLLRDPDSSLRADVVIAEPPLGLRWDAEGALLDPRFEFGLPSKLSADSAWLQHVIHHLSQDGRGFVITTLGALNRRGAEQKIRAEMLRKGVIEAIIQLPHKMLRNTHIQTAMWVLRRPSTVATGTVLLVDASGELSPENDAAGWLHDEQGRAGVPHVEVTIAELLDEGDLLPASWVERAHIESTDYSNALVEAFESLKSDSKSATESIANLKGLHVDAGTTQRSLEELQRAGIIEILTASHFRKDAKSRLGQRDEQRISIADVKRGDFPAEKLVELSSPATSLQGDVFVATLGSVHGAYDSEGGHVPAAEVAVLRVLKAEILDPRFLAFVLTDQGQRAVGTTIQRYPLSSLSIPVVSFDQQTEIAKFAAQLQKAKVSSNRLNDHFRSVSDNLRSALLKGDEINV
jgi:hypothetical protein